MLDYYINKRLKVIFFIIKNFESFYQVYIFYHFLVFLLTIKKTCNTKNKFI